MDSKSAWPNDKIKLIYIDPPHRHHCNIPTPGQIERIITHRVIGILSHITNQYHPYPEERKMQKIRRRLKAHGRVNDN